MVVPASTARENRGKHVNKTFKGAVAAAVAASLLLGGAGSLAYWNADGNVGGATISAGSLDLGDPTCGTWASDLLGGALFDPAVGELVPGDTLTRTCDFVVDAVGNHMVADLEVGTATFAQVNALSSALTVTGAFSIDGSAVTQISTADDGKNLRVQLTVTFAEGTSVDNTTQNLDVTLNAVSVTATQDHS